MAGTSTTSLVVAAAFVLAALTGLGVALYQLELGPAARRRRRLHHAVTRAERVRAPAAENGDRLSTQDLARLTAFRPRARLMAGEPLGRPEWLAKLRLMWREGHAGWIVATMVGAFSMATHFGAYWLIAGGGWLGAAVVTVASTILMTAVGFWILLGLLGARG